jgi:hypothetical protein
MTNICKSRVISVRNKTRETYAAFLKLAQGRLAFFGGPDVDLALVPA